MSGKGKQASEQTLARRIALLDRLPVSHSGGEAIDTVGSVWRSIGIELQHVKDEDDARLARWRHTPNSKAMLFRTLSNEEALLLILVEQELKFFMPASAYESLMHYVKASNRGSWRCRATSARRSSASVCA